MTPEPLIWKRGTLYVLDQLALPASVSWRPCQSAADVLRVIDERRVRGTSAIACAAAYAIALAARARIAAGDTHAPVLLRAVEDAVEGVRRAVPSSVQTFWALAQVRNAGRISTGTADAFMVADAIEARACAIHAEDVARNQRIGAAGAELLADGSTVLTLGNHGQTAILRAAWNAARRVRVLVCDPLTAWALAHDGLHVTVITESAAPGVLARREAQSVLLGAERISPAGDVVTDLGTYGIALAASAASIPLHVAACAAAIDPAARAISTPTADVIPGALITSIVTEHGVLRPPWATSLRSG